MPSSRVRSARAGSPPEQPTPPFPRHPQSPSSCSRRSTLLRHRALSRTAAPHTRLSEPTERITRAHSPAAARAVLRSPLSPTPPLSPPTCPTRHLPGLPSQAWTRSDVKRRLCSQKRHGAGVTRCQRWVVRERLGRRAAGWSERELRRRPWRRLRSMPRRTRTRRMRRTRTGMRIWRRRRMMRTRTTTMTTTNGLRATRFSRSRP
mmetsp:Transcript_16723/g.40355  ORF Transcript_16723/g.40355 Transcript_16723/m.40355 type:complete len:205 (+) Transcript_16723:291-905(+)